MDPTLLETPLVFAPTAPTASSAARLRALSPQEYWLQLARELTWHTPPSSAHEGSFGDFRYFAGATGNVSVNCLDRVPAERVALHYEREDGLRETWSYGRLTDAVARFATVLSQLRGFGRGAVRSRWSAMGHRSLGRCYQRGRASAWDDGVGSGAAYAPCSLGGSGRRAAR